MGKPEPPTREQTTILKNAAFATKKEKIKVNTKSLLILKRTLQPWDCLLLHEA